MKRRTVWMAALPVVVAAALLIGRGRPRLARTSGRVVPGERPAWGQLAIRARLR